MPFTRANDTIFNLVCGACFGGIAAVMAFYHTGPEMVWEENTGGMVLNGLLPTLFCVFIFAGMLLPLLLNFGLLELFGTLLSKIMRPIFNLRSFCYRLYGILVR